VAYFPVSGVTCPLWLPPLVTLAISSLTTSGGISGAVLLLPLQVSLLGYTGPGVSPTNLIYNIVAIPGGVYRYIREGRMTWPLTWTVIIGTLPGVFVGALIRIRYLPDPRRFKLFAGGVLLYLGARLLYEVFGPRRVVGLSGVPRGARVRVLKVSPARIEYEFLDRVYAFTPAALSALALVVGLVGGIYGIGGGAIIAPFVVSILRLPVYTVAGAALMGTFVTSVAGVTFFHLLALDPRAAAARPDWALGALFGVGGLAGTYIGARLQRHLPERWIKLLLSVLISALGLSYILQFFL